VPEVSIIIPVFNALHYTLGCIESILRHPTRYRYEILVADDCSTDRTPAVMALLRHIRHLPNAANAGFLRTCNNAAKQARGQYLVLLNNDTRVLASWLDELIDTFLHTPRAGLVGSKLIYPTGVLQEAGGIIWSDGSGWNYGRGDQRDKPARR